jgi:hypothetical protein
MTAKKSIILRNQSGAALVIALIMLIVITLIALASSYTSIFEIKMSGNKRGLTDAFYVADGGVNAIASSPASFNTSVSGYIVLVGNTLGLLGYDPFASPPNPNIPNPTKIPPVNAPLTTSNAPIIWYNTKSGPPRGSGFSAVNMNYAYFQVQCAGNDSVGSGAMTTIQEDVVVLKPAQQ